MTIIIPEDYDPNKEIKEALKAIRQGKANTGKAKEIE